MKAQIGDRVEIKNIPWRGRTGVLERKRRILGLVRVWDVRCDEPDAMGRMVVTVGHRGFRRIQV